LNREWLGATSAGDVQRVLALLDAGADIDALDKHGQTALMNASHRGDAGLVQALVARGAKLNHTAKYRLTALMLAVIAGHPEVVRILVAAGADREIKGSKGPFAYTPLQYAEEHGMSQLTDLLRNGT
jgi:ankyrin repeat protein